VGGYEGQRPFSCSRIPIKFDLSEANKTHDREVMPKTFFDVKYCHSSSAQSAEYGDFGKTFAQE
jgi:hypothetical protein